MRRRQFAFNEDVVQLDFRTDEQLSLDQKMEVIGRSKEEWLAFFKRLIAYEIGLYIDGLNKNKKERQQTDSEINSLAEKLVLAKNSLAS